MTHHQKTWQRRRRPLGATVTEPTVNPCLFVVAGTNGAGKSSLAGAMQLQQAGEFFNPDDVAKRLHALHPGWSQEEVNAEAWQEGVRLLRRAIVERLTFFFETTLGGRTITGLLEAAASSRMEVRIWYVGLASPELHIARVRARVERGGHDVPEQRIRARYDQSCLNLIRLLPALSELRVFDNSKEAEPETGAGLQPKLLLHLHLGMIVGCCDPGESPDWAKPILMAAMKLEPFMRWKDRRL